MPVPSSVRGRPEALFRMVFPGLVVATLSCAAAHNTPAAVVPTGFSDELIVGGLRFPTGIAFLPDGRLLVVEQKSSRILLVRHSGVPRADSAGFVPNVNTGGSERGLLGIAVDPAWPSRPYIYTHSNDLTGKIKISRFKVSGALTDPAGTLSIDPASRYDLITDIPDNAFNHNGGTVRFAPDGTLYVSLGEDATSPAAQDTTSLRGVILRLAVDGLPDGPGTASRAQITPAGNPFAGVGGLNARLIWEYGLRNPFRFQFDHLTGELLIADVGENTWEEVDIANHGGMNFGWPHYEGDAVFSSGQPLTGPATFPIFTLNHSTGAAAIMAAAIYRHPAGGTRSFPAAYEGDAFVSDYFSSVMVRLHRDGDTWAVAAPVPGQPSSGSWGTGFDQVSDYAIGAEGGLWYCRQSGEIRRVVSTATSNVPPPASLLEFSQPYPLPSAGRVEFDWVLPALSRVTLAIHDVRGRRVRSLIGARSDAPGRYHATWNGLDAGGRAVGSGIYFARLTVNGQTLEHRVPVVR